ncbi:uncharacterized protein LOC143230586 [Tachypleus tridentatus]|uniref:uncharacterized protein LOC143230586 n=1 Tax=Tachypleus tridentatus TaxID=6853 RepID=UPI003FD66E51
MNETGDPKRTLSLKLFPQPNKKHESEENGGRFSRNTLARRTVVRRCREFYAEKLKRSETFRKRWSTCGVGINVDSPITLSPTPSLVSPVTANVQYLNRDFDSSHQFGSSLDLTMDQLRREIGSLIDEDNELFRKLLSLYDTIAELRDRQQMAENDTSDEDEDSPSLESLSDGYNQTNTTSPSSTLSSSSSHCVPNKPRFAQRRSHGTQMKNTAQCHLSTNNEECLRCCSKRKMAPQYDRRRARSFGTLYYRDDDVPSYDSGVYLQGYHSDSEQEIFV